MFSQRPRLKPSRVPWSTSLLEVQLLTPGRGTGSTTDPDDQRQRRRLDGPRTRRSFEARGAARVAPAGPLLPGERSSARRARRAAPARRKRKRGRQHAGGLRRRSHASRTEAQTRRSTVDCASCSGSALVGRPRGLGKVDGGRPASEQVQRFLGAGAGFGGVGEERQPVVGGDV